LQERQLEEAIPLQLWHELSQAKQVGYPFYVVENQ